MTTLSTIQSYIDAGYTVTAHHEAIGHNPCSHYSDLDLVALAERLGPDFDIVDNHDWFVSKLVCARCGRRGSMSITISPPRR